MEGKLVIASASGRDVELYGDKKEDDGEGEKSLSPEDVSMLLEFGDGLSTWARVDDKPWRRISMARSKDKLRGKKSTDGK